MRFMRYTRAVVAAALFCAAPAFGQTITNNEVGRFQNAAPLNGAERILADQNAVTVNLTPAQIGQYLGIPGGLFFPLPVSFGGTGSATSTQGLINLLPSPLVAQSCLAVNTPGTAVLWANCGTGGTGAFQVNGVPLSSAATINFQNSSATSGLTLSYSNPSAGNVRLGLSGTLVPSGGGTGLSATPTNGQIPIGNGTGYTLGTISAGSNVTVTNTPGGISIAAAGSGSGTVNPGTTGQVPTYATSGTTVSGQSLTAFNAAMIAANQITCADSPTSGPLVAYNPSCWGTTVGVLNITPASGGTTICSLVAGSDKQDVLVKNVGTAPIFVLNECSSDATAQNRFDMEANFMIGPGGVARVTAVTATARWNLL